MISAIRVMTTACCLLSITAIGAVAQSRLENGDRGADVERLQRQLMTLGYNIKVDGKFGQSTEIAVREFQRKVSMVVDGVVGAGTWRALQAGAAAPSGTSTERKLELRSPRMFGNDVKDAQALLRKAGLTVGDDGVYGTGTVSAVREFQRRKGLAVDGRVGPDTWRTLRGT